MKTTDNLKVLQMKHAMTNNPLLVDYVIDRLADLGIEHAFGVPGDGAFHIDDAIESSDRVTWVGCSNELNAAYAAERLCADPRSGDPDDHLRRR